LERPCCEEKACHFAGGLEQERLALPTGRSGLRRCRLGSRSALLRLHRNSRKGQGRQAEQSGGQERAAGGRGSRNANHGSPVTNKNLNAEWRMRGIGDPD
jgi:hypothetical protein